MRVATSVNLLVIVMMAVSATAACGPTVQTGFEDARITMRVRTALLNDPQLGTEAIEIVVRGGNVELRGRVSSADLAERAENVVRRVEGVRDVTASFEVGPREAVGRDRPGRLPSIPGPNVDGPTRLIAVGVGSTYAVTPDRATGNGFGVGPTIRLRPRTGWGPSIGFSWTKTPLRRSPSGKPPLATLAVRPVMAGIEYGVSRGRLASAFSVIGGYAFNSLAVDATRSGPDRAIAVENGLALRVGVSTWYDVSSRLGLNFFGGYRHARPTVVFAGVDSVSKQRLNADAVLISVGLAYWIF